MSHQIDTVFHQLNIRAERTPHLPAYWHRDSEQNWKSTTWDEVRNKVCNLARHLLRLGLIPGDRVALMMPTLPEWEYCQLAILAIGGVVVGMDAHDAPENIRHILDTVRPRALFLATRKQFEELKGLLPEAPVFVVTLESAGSSGVHSLLELLMTTADTAAAWPTVGPDHTASIIFTSGSTGQPKGIAYTHRQLCQAGAVILARFPGIQEGARLACWLPMSNLFQRIINLCAIMCGAQCYFVESPTEIIRRLPEIRPILFIGVPRFFEKLHAGIQAEVAKRPLLIRKLVQFAWGIGERFRKLQREGHAPGLPLAAAHALADRLVLRRLRDMMGPDLQFMVSGSAPMPPWLLDKLHGLGWLVLEAYGISECVVPIAINSPDAYRFGSVGRALPGNEVKLAEDGELLVRGAGVFTGYYGVTDIDTPLDTQAYLHTGDYARVDEAGYVWLTGRKSEIFKTSTGRRIAPTSVEASLKQLVYVEHAVLFGRNRPVSVALLCLNIDALPEARTAETLPTSLLESIGRDVATTCASLPAYQRPAGTLLTRRSFSITGGELTSNLKLRRNSIEDKYRADLDALYHALAQSTERSHCLVLEVP
jgi:long-chain acyl-CoA synthetase